MLNDQKKEKCFKEVVFSSVKNLPLFSFSSCLESTNFTSASSWFSCGHFYSFLLPLSVFHG